MKEIIYKENCSGFYWRCVCGKSSSFKEKIQHMAQCLAEENDLTLVIGPEIIEKSKILNCRREREKSSFGLAPYGKGNKKSFPRPFQSKYIKSKAPVLALF